MEGEKFGIAELAGQAGVTPRTVRYYVAEGLLPPPGGAGQNRAYTREHLLRLEAIKRMKSVYLPLAEIRRRMAELSPDELEQLAASPAAPPSTALEYLAGLVPPTIQPAAPGPGSPSVTPASARATPSLAEPVRAQLGFPTPPRRATGSPPAAGPSAANDSPAATTWQRVVLAPGVELHFQPSDDPGHRAAIARLIREAATLLPHAPRGTTWGP